MSELIKKATEGSPLLTAAEAFATGLADKLYEEYLPLIAGVDPVGGEDHNKMTRLGGRYFVARLAELLDPKGYEISRILFSQAMKLIDDSYFDAREVRRGLKLNMQFKWGPVLVPRNTAGAPMKRVKDCMSIRIAVYYNGVWAYDISGIFAQPKQPKG